MFLLRAAILLVFFAALAAGCATAREGEAPAGPIVRSVEISGTEHLKPSSVKGKILTTETSFLAFLPNWLPETISPPDHRFDPNAWQADLRRVERYYQAQGYYQAKVVDDAVTPDGKGGVDVKITVQEGEPTKISNVAISGLDPLAEGDRATVLEELPLVKGEVFVEDHWAGVKNTIQQRLRELGYAEAEVEGTVSVDVEKRTADVEVQVRPGERYKFGNVYVAQDDRPKVPSKRIVEQARGSVEKGAWYSETALAEAQARVFKMGVFGGVKVTRGAPDRDSGTVPVVVDVREAPFHSIRAGPGIGVDAARQELRGVAAYTDRNFFGGLRKLTVTARAGYAWLPDFVQPNKQGPVFDVLAEFEQPRFLLRDVRLQTSAELENSIEEAYQYLGFRGKLAGIWQPHPTFSITGSYNYEAYDLNRGTLGFSDIQAGAPAIVLGCPQDALGRTKLCVLSYLEQLMEWDRRNDPLEPSRGFYTNFGLQEGGGFLGGSFGYLRVLSELRGYTSFDEDKWVLSGKVRGGTLLPYGDQVSPIVARFFSGGANSMRGFSNRRLSPFVVVEDPQARDQSGQIAQVARLGTTEPVGGNSLFETSVELRYRAFKNLSFAVFYDTGFVQNGSFPSGGFFGALHHAVGTGVRLITPVGPVRLDVATRIAGPPLQLASNYAPEFSYVPQGSCFGFGHFSGNYPGSPESLCSFHLSIGEAF